jgi:hypothetical protein
MAHKAFNTMNQATLYALRKNVSRFWRKDETNTTLTGKFFFEVALTTPNRADGESLESARLAEIVVTKQGTFKLADMPNTATIAFDVKIFSQGKSNFNHPLLALANDNSRIIPSEHKVFCNVERKDNGSYFVIIENEESELRHIGATFETGEIAYMIANHLKMSQNDKQRKMWKRENGNIVTTDNVVEQTKAKLDTLVAIIKDENVKAAIGLNKKDK